MRPRAPGGRHEPLCASRREEGEEVFGLDPQRVANPAEIRPASAVKARSGTHTHSRVNHVCRAAMGAAIQGGVRWGTAWRPQFN